MIIMNIVERYYKLRQARDNSGKSTIYLRAYVNGQLVELGSTNVKIDKKRNWCKKTNTVKNPDSNKDIEALSERLEASKAVINDITKFYNKENILLTAASLKQEFNQAVKNNLKFQTKDTLSILDLFEVFTKDQQTKKEKDKLALNTFRDYSYKIEKLKLYTEQTNSIITIARIDRSFVYNFKKWLIQHHNNTESSANKYIMRIKVVLDFAVNAGLIMQNPISDVKTPQNYEENHLHLTKSQIIKLHLYKFHSQKIQKSVDMYVFSCSTGICYADQVKLKSENVNMIEKYIIDFRQKTKTRYTAPIGYIAERIILKYGSVEQMPKISNQKANDYIKLALHEIGIKNAFDYTFHSGRKSFVNYCLNRKRNPINPFDLIKMVGHSSVDELNAYGKRSDKNVIQSFF